MTEELMMARMESLMEMVEELTETVSDLEDRLERSEVELGYVADHVGYS